MRRLIARERIPFRVFAATAGVVLLAFLIRQFQPHQLSAEIATVGSGLVVVIFLAGVSHVLKTWAWRLTLTGENTSFWRLFGLRLASEAGGQLGIIGQIFGDGMRISLLNKSLPADAVISSVALERGLFMIAGVVTSIVGIAAGLLVLPLSHRLQLSALLFLAVLMGLLVLLALAVRNRWPVFSRTAQIASHFASLRRWIDAKQSIVESIETKLLDFHHDMPGAFWACFGLNFVCHLMAVFEVFLILWCMGASVGLFGALLIEALTKVLNAVGAFNPGNIGTYEGGNVLLVKMFGLGGAAGLALGIARRIRSLFWAAVGAICMTILSKSKKQETAGGISQRKLQVVNPEPTAVVIANSIYSNDESVPPLMRVGGIPILLRAVLRARKAGAARIIVLVNPVSGPRVQHDLLRTGRVPNGLEWVTVEPDACLWTTLKDIAGQAGGKHLLLIAGDRTYHSSLFRKAVEWTDESCGLALATGERVVGICAIPLAMMLSAVTDDAVRANNLEELYVQVTSQYFLQCMQVEDDLWQHVISGADRAPAERKLDRWLVKPTDGFFAQMNRKISIRISRQLVKLPITPNMVTLFTLSVSITSAAFFATGGYLNVLWGASLSLAASILDGCDGEVARLTLRESDFGCWLETICDYLYYVLIFCGLTMGLTRSSGTGTWLIWGSALLFGTILSLVATGFSRRWLARDRPEQLLQIWHAHADRKRSNPLVYISRHTEFMTRRCFLPYALLFFALVNLTKVVFILSAIGANIVWILALYSYWLIARSGSSRAAGAPQSVAA
ncbi:MAG: flippase-like domain-containing protein [Acidobacteriaceae bacterium]|nr:flippase-like domain-containing protein [Acidobacteriaceae bacterium]